LKTSFISDILNDKSLNFEYINKLLRETFGVARSSLEDRRLIKECCELVTIRAARLSAAAIGAVVSKTGRFNCTAAVDGGVFEHIPNFKEEMQKALKELYPASDIDLKLTRDGSGIGAAIIAATVM